LDNKSNTSAFQNVKSKVLDLREQLVRLKEKENEKEKARVKKLAGEKGKELTEEEIAQLMFEDEYEQSAGVVSCSVFLFFSFLSFFTVCVDSLPFWVCVCVCANSLTIPFFNGGDLHSVQKERSLYLSLLTATRRMTRPKSQGRCAKRQ
jgi:hypothetical protein